MRKRIIAAVLCFLIIFTSIPVQEVVAAETGGGVATYTVTYQGNYNTAGTVPATETVSAGASYTVQAPSADFIKEVGTDVYLFQCWNTREDGSGTDYYVNQTIEAVNENITLYAKWLHWVQEYQIMVITNLDGVQTNIGEILGDAELNIYVKRNEATEYLLLQNVENGVYTANVLKNGTYKVYVGKNGSYTDVHGHEVNIYNQSGQTVLQHYSVTYDKNDGVSETVKKNYHARTAVTVDEANPTRDGYQFAGWKVGDSNTILQSGNLISAELMGPVVLTAQWVELVDVTVNITIQHKVQTGDGVDNSDQKSNVSIQLLREEGGYNIPVRDEVTLTSSSAGYTYSEEKKETSYVYVFEDVPKGKYHISTAKSGYALERTHVSENVIALNYTYDPSNFDLNFTVNVNGLTDANKHLLPKAVNVKVSYWGYNRENELGWHIITQQDGTKAPTSVLINQTTGVGNGFFPVWKHWSDSGQPYYYRLEVISYVMPDGNVLPASSSDQIIYSVNGSGLYTGTISVLSGGKPSYPDGTNTALEGSYYDGSAQVGTPTVAVTLNPITVTFEASDGEQIGTNDQGADVILNNQYKYPDISTLDSYIPTWKGEGNKQFDGWYVKDSDNDLSNDAAAATFAGSYLFGNAVLYAKWKDTFVVSGEITVDKSYDLNGTPTLMNDVDRVSEIMVILQKRTGDVYNDVASQIVTITYEDDKPKGTASYNLTQLDDGADYQIYTIALNYGVGYDNDDDNDNTYTSDERKIVRNSTDSYKIDVHLSFTPDSYAQAVIVDSSQIHKYFRPTSVAVDVWYRDITSLNDYDKISQHSAGGMNLNIDENGTSMTTQDVWKWHTNGGLYEYQMKISKLYGQMDEVFTTVGNDYQANVSPYRIQYSIPAWWNDSIESGTSPLRAVLIPNEYTVTFDLNLGESNDPVYGMTDYLTDNPNGANYYSAAHTWSYQDDLIAFPYREGYVFQGWECENSEDIFINNHGYVTIGAGLDRDVTLKAKWQEITDTAYTVRYLLWDEDKSDAEKTVLHGAKVVEANDNAQIKAHDEYVELLGYKPHKVSIGGNEAVDWPTDPSLTVTDNNTKNTIIIYYKKDDGYIESPDSNLHVSKTATLEDDGTYTIQIETYTTDNPITTQILQNTPLDIVLVLDQSGSVVRDGYLDELQGAVSSFITQLADHGRTNEIDHRVAMVGYASNESCGPSNDFEVNGTIIKDVFADGKENNNLWVNTGVFDSNGDFHRYSVKGFNYEIHDGSIEADGTYYTYENDSYLLLMYHEEYYHLISEDKAKEEILNGTPVYGYANNQFVQLRRNTSGLWLYGGNALYSMDEFFTKHNDVWTHRDGLNPRQIHAYGTGNNYRAVDGFTDVYTRDETTSTNPQLSIYKDALVPVSVSANGAGSLNPKFTKGSGNIGSSGGTFAQYGMDMANEILSTISPEEKEERVQVVVMFTDGQPGQYGYDEAVANATIASAYTAKNTHGAYVYTIGLYHGNAVDSFSQTAIYMNAVSSNYPQAQNVGDIVKPSNKYTAVGADVNINDGGTYYVKNGNDYQELTYKYVYGWFKGYGWYYGDDNKLTGDQNAVTNSRGQISSKNIYTRVNEYEETQHSGYYSTTESVESLEEYFSNVLQQITTNITTEIVLHSDTIIRDIMGEGFELTAGTEIKAYTQPGTYNAETKEIDWSTDTKNELGTLTIGTQSSAVVNSTQTYTDSKGEVVPIIQVYNLDKSNTTKPLENDYHPHTVDITGYDFNEYYMNETHPDGAKVIVTITKVEARDEVVWGRSTKTNNEQSGIWLPKDSQGNRQLLMAFEQPTTMFVERAYVLDYAKQFELSGWYFDKVTGNDAVGAIHMDMDQEDGMNYFGTPVTSSEALNAEGTNQNKATEYGNATIVDKLLSYAPTTMQWGAGEEFYVFGKTDNDTVKYQDANRNGNLWSKVRVIPANNVYYEDSFVTTEVPADRSNAVDGFTFTGTWKTVYNNDDPSLGGKNTEHPESVEAPGNGGVHGWTNDLANDKNFSDDSAHWTKTPGANVEFTFTGTGVDVYTRTNNDSGMVVALLYRVSSEDGTERQVLEQSISMDNLAVSGDYYSIPTISFQDLTHGTYKVKLIATVASGQATGVMRYEYYLDGIRVYNPLGTDVITHSDSIKDAYGKEQNAVFKEVRDVLLDYEDFDPDLESGQNEKAGAVFIDWIREGQGDSTVNPGDTAGTGVPTYSVGTFDQYGPKNEVYLSPGQAIVLKVNPENHYYVGLKSLKGTSVIANITGTAADAADKQIVLDHSTDMYYEVTPTEGYIVIENGSAEGDDAPILSITKLRATNIKNVDENGGILPITSEEAVSAMTLFALRRNPPQEDEDQENSGSGESGGNEESGGSQGTGGIEGIGGSDESGKSEGSTNSKPSDTQSQGPVEIIISPSNTSGQTQNNTTDSAEEPITETVVLEESEEHNRAEDSIEEQGAEKEDTSETEETKEIEETEGLLRRIIRSIIQFFKNCFEWICNLLGGKK